MDIRYNIQPNAKWFAVWIAVLVCVVLVAYWTTRRTVEEFIADWDSTVVLVTRYSNGRAVGTTAVSVTDGDSLNMLFKNNGERRLAAAIAIACNDYVKQSRWTVINLKTLKKTIEDVQSQLSDPEARSKNLAVLSQLVVVQRLLASGGYKFAVLRVQSSY